MLEAFRGRFSFRQYIPNKPAKYGIKIFALVDSACYYMSNLEIYAGKQMDGPQQVVDNWFSSISLAEELVQRHKLLSMLGTIRKNQKNLRKTMTQLKVGGDRRFVGSSMFAYRDNVTYQNLKGQIYVRFLGFITPENYSADGIGVH